MTWKECQLSFAKCTQGLEHVSSRRELLWDGSLLLAVTAILGSEALGLLYSELERGLQNGEIENDTKTKVLILSGTHGDDEGNSVLTEVKYASWY